MSIGFTQLAPVIRPEIGSFVKYVGNTCIVVGVSRKIYYPYSEYILLTQGKIFHGVPEYQVEELAEPPELAEILRIKSREYQRLPEVPNLDDDLVSPSSSEEEVYIPITIREHMGEQFFQPRDEGLTTYMSRENIGSRKNIISGSSTIEDLETEELGDEIETDSRRRYERLTDSSNPVLLRALVKERDSQVLGMAMVVNEEIETRMKIYEDLRDAEETIRQLRFLEAESEETNLYHKWLKENHSNLWKEYDTKRMEYSLTPKQGRS